MAVCTVCGEKLPFYYAEAYDRCHKCTAADKWPDGHPMQLKQALMAEQVALETALEKEKFDKINSITLTTETAPNLNITKRIEIVTAEVAFGMNIFKDLFAGIRDIVGGRSEAVQATMRDSRRTALYELKKEAHAVGANAVVGVDLDYVELSGAGAMVMLVASGTAVVID